MEQESPLRGVRVVECCGWNGVFAGRLLADGGADVVRVVPLTGDPLASEPPFVGDTGVSIQETWYNAGKRVVALDVAAAAAGREALLGLIADCDVLVEDWGSAAPLSDETLRGANAKLARVSVTPMGLTGPGAGLRTNDLVANALCGAASVTGTAQTPPLTGYGNQTYHTVGLYVAICGLAAMRAARATGEMQHVDLSAHEALVSCTEQLVMQWFFPGGSWNTPIAARQGSLHWSTAYEVYEAKDGQGVMVSAALHFADVLLPWLKEDGAAQDLADAEKYPTILSMIRDLPYVMKVLREWVATYNGDDLFFESQKRREPFGVVWDVARAAATPQIAARRYFQPVPIAGDRTFAMPGRLFRSDADEGHPAPGRTVGADEVGWLPRATVKGTGRSATAGAPLAGVRVLDFTHVLAGPFGTRVLGDLGADVIKITAASRAGGANTPDHPYYICWNRNKRNVSLNMAMPEAREVARKLAAHCDVITENFSAGVLKRWGLDRGSLAETNPGLSVIAMGGMGQDGPWSDFVTFAPTIHALTGLTYLTNPAGRHDLGYGFSLTDHLSGLAGALAAIEAVEHRDRTGMGLDIDLAQYELGLGIMAPALMDYLANGVSPEPRGNRHPFSAWAPHGIYRCAGDDEWVAIAVRGDDEWAKLCGVIGDRTPASDTRFASHAGRIEHEAALDALIEAWTLGMGRYDVMARCQAAGIAAGAVQNAADLASRDRQIAAREFFGTLNSVNWGEHGYDRFPALFNGQRPTACEGVHGTGADMFDVLTDLLGMSDAEVAELAGLGALT